MKAKPHKCKSLGLSRTNVSFRNPTPYATRFSAFDPTLTISGCEIAFLAHNPFKFLGRVIFTDLSDVTQRASVFTQLPADMPLIYTTPLKRYRKSLDLQQLCLILYLLVTFDILISTHVCQQINCYSNTLH